MEFLTESDNIGPGIPFMSYVFHVELTFIICRYDMLYVSRGGKNVSAVTLQTNTKWYLRTERKFMTTNLDSCQEEAPHIYAIFIHKHTMGYRGRISGDARGSATYHKSMLN